MALEYVLGNFLTGAVTTRNLPVTKGTDKAVRDIDGGSMEIEVQFDALPEASRNDWKNTFKPLARFVALIDNEKPVSDPSAVLACGFINKVHAPVGKGFIRLQMAPVNEYLETLPAIELWEGARADSTEPEAEEPVFSASTWDGLMRTLMSKAFAPAPAGAPQVPSMITGITAAPAGDRTVKDIADGTTFLSLLEEIRDTASEVGVEWRFDPYFIDSTTIGFAFITGTEAAPHINEASVVSVDLSATSSQNISGFSTTIDSRDLFNKVYIRYEKAGATADSDTVGEVVAGWSATDIEVPLAGKYVNTSRELTATQVDALKQAYIEDGESGGLELAFTVEENWDKSEWIGNVGKTVNFVGVPSTISAGHTTSARCVGVEFSVQKGTIVATFMAPQSKYPTLPKKKKKESAFTPAKRVGWTQEGSRGAVITPGGTTLPGDGGYTPPPTPEPTDSEWANEGVLNPEDLWGSEGRNPWDDFPSKAGKPAFANYKESTTTYSEWDGEVVVHPQTVVQTEGNRLYGLDELVIGWASIYEGGVETVSIQGGINRSTGLPVDPNRIKPVYVKKSHMAAGTIARWETVGELPVAKIMEAFPEWKVNPLYPENGHFRSQIFRNFWYVKGRLYVGLLWSHLTTKSPINQAPNNDHLTDGYFVNQKVRYFSIALNMKTGSLSGDWRVENFDFPNQIFPNCGSIGRWGDVVIFGSGHAYHERPLMNVSWYELTELIDPRSRRPRHVKGNGYYVPGVFGVDAHHGLNDDRDDSWLIGVAAKPRLYAYIGKTVAEGDSIVCESTGISSRNANITIDFSDPAKPMLPAISFFPHSVIDAAPKLGFSAANFGSVDGVVLGASLVYNSSHSVIQASQITSTTTATSLGLKGSSELQQSNATYGHSGSITGSKGWAVVAHSEPYGGGGNVALINILHEGRLGEVRYASGEMSAFTQNYQSGLSVNADTANDWRQYGSNWLNSRVFSYDGIVYSIYMWKDAGATAWNIKSKSMEVIEEAI